jgi:Pentapeptide repeats (8 copies)
VKTSGATAVQIVYSSRRGSREIEHLGPAHTGAEVEFFNSDFTRADFRNADLTEAQLRHGSSPRRSSPTVNSGQ